MVSGDRGCLAGRGQKGGEKVARSLTGRSASRFHLAVDANGSPLEIRLSAGNENERRHLLPLVDSLISRGIHPCEVWADRGYDSSALSEALLAREIEPHISRRRKAKEPIPDSLEGREVWRGKKRTVKTRDPEASKRWPVERTNAWMKSMRRIAIRRDRKASNYLAFLHLAMILILARLF